ncbi:transmembrane protein 17B-like isoform X1 [Pelobates fuscus]|uniref:transmembrane protein 17B-like isoform X1 n=1 Tax=Pelobates fuscus TaxID=191477 RepID=UPI002FE4733D
MALRTPLPCNIRHSLASISGSVFTQNKTRDCGGDRQSYHTGHYVGANLPLQMLLYFNSLFFPFWFMSEILILELKYHLLTCYYQILQIIGLSILTLVECLRLYLGYIGNLYEKVPELAAFLLLTFMIQIPLILFLLTDEEVLILPLEYAVHAIYIVFLSVELIVSFFVLKFMTRTLATEFFLHHSDDTEKDLLGRNLCQGM